MQNTIIGTPIPQPVTRCFLTRLWWCLAEHDRRTAELNAKRETAAVVVTAAAETRRATAKKGGAKNA